MKFLLTLFFLFVIAAKGKSQNLLYNIPSYQEYLLGVRNKNSISDTIQMEGYMSIVRYQKDRNLEEAYQAANSGFVLARNLNFQSWETWFLVQKAYAAQRSGEKVAVGKWFDEAIGLATDNSEKKIWRPEVFSKDKNIQNIRLYLQAYTHLYKALYYAPIDRSVMELEYLSALSYTDKLNDDIGRIVLFANLSNHYKGDTKFDYCIDSTLKLLEVNGIKEANPGFYHVYYGIAKRNQAGKYFQDKSFNIARSVIKDAYQGCVGDNCVLACVRTNLLTAEIYKSLDKLDSSLFYAKKAMELSLKFNDIILKDNSYATLADIYLLKRDSTLACRYLLLGRELHQSQCKKNLEQFASQKDSSAKSVIALKDNKISWLKIALYGACILWLFTIFFFFFYKQRIFNWVNKPTALSTNNKIPFYETVVWKGVQAILLLAGSIVGFFTTLVGLYNCVFGK